MSIVDVVPMAVLGVVATAVALDRVWSAEAPAQPRGDAGGDPAPVVVAPDGGGPPPSGNDPGPDASTSEILIRNGAARVPSSPAGSRAPTLAAPSRAADGEQADEFLIPVSPAAPRRLLRGYSPLRSTGDEPAYLAPTPPESPPATPTVPPPAREIRRSAAPAAPHPDGWLATLRAVGTRVQVVFTDGSLVTARLLNFDGRALLIDVQGTTWMVFRHAVRLIRPDGETAESNGHSQR